MLFVQNEWGDNELYFSSLCCLLALWLPVFSLSIVLRVMPKLVMEHFLVRKVVLVQDYSLFQGISKSLYHKIAQITFSTTHLARTRLYIATSKFLWELKLKVNLKELVLEIFSLNLIILKHHNFISFVFQNFLELHNIYYFGILQIGQGIISKINSNCEFLWLLSLARMIFPPVESEVVDSKLTRCIM